MRDIRQIKNNKIMSGFSFHLISDAFQHLFQQLHQKLEHPITSDQARGQLILLREDMERVLEKMEETLVLLDMDGTWELSEEDWKRLKQQHQVMELYKSILPIVLLSNNIKVISAEEHGERSEKISPSSEA